MRGPQSGLAKPRAKDGASSRNDAMNNREEQFVMQAAEHARERAVRDAEADRIADEIIDRIIAENPSDPVQIARRDEAHERALMALAARIAESGTVETGSLPGIRRALMLKIIGVPVALTLAYRVGVDSGRGQARRGSARP
jgi:hypothetical protein